MPAPLHPDLGSVPLAAALHALSDPVRLGMVARLAAAEELNCGAAACPDMAVPKSTLSNHLTVLRAAGLIETRAVGREKVNTLRRTEFEARFPGLLDTLLSLAPPERKA
jgi:DNA-binding transcriptional ArsR family regulator